MYELTDDDWDTIEWYVHDTDWDIGDRHEIHSLLKRMADGHRKDAEDGEQDE